MIFAPFAFQNQVVSTSVPPTSSAPTLNPTVYDGTFLYLNASASNSYPGTGTNWTSIAPTGSNVTASLVNGVIYETGSIKSFNFDGSNDYASIPYYTASSPTTGITLLAWVNLDTYDGNRTILSKSNTVGATPPYLQYSLKMDGAASPFNRPQFNVNVGGTAREVNGNDITVPLNTWVLLAGTYDGGTLKIYKNGVQSTTTTGASGSISAFTTDIQIGRWLGNGTQLWDGKMSLIMGVNKALTTAEILNIYEETVDYYYPPEVVSNNLQVYLDAGVTSSYSGTGTTWNDLSSNAYTFSLNNGPIYTSGDGGYFTFDGTNDYISDYAYTTQYTGSNLTYCAVLRYENKASSYHNIFDNTPTDTNPMLWVSNTNKLECDKASGYTSPLSYTDQTIMLTMTHSNTGGEGVKLYINGNYIGGNTAAQGAIGSNKYFSLGNRALGSFYKGRIYNIMFYNKVLSPYEVYQNYNALRSRYGI